MFPSITLLHDLRSGLFFINHQYRITFFVQPVDHRFQPFVSNLIRFLVKDFIGGQDAYGATVGVECRPEEQRRVGDVYSFFGIIGFIDGTTLFVDEGGFAERIGMLHLLVRINGNTVGTFFVRARFEKQN